MSALAPAKPRRRHETGMLRARLGNDWHASDFAFGARAKPSREEPWAEEPDDDLEDMIRRCREGGTLRPMEG